MSLDEGKAAQEHFRNYGMRLARVIESLDCASLARLAAELKGCWRERRRVFIAGNGGSAGNAVHLANDFLYAMSKRPGSGLCVEALPANPAVLTCLANDEGFDSIFALQLAVQARAGDVLIVFSGSGNSPNILRALKEAKRIGLSTYALLGYSGGAAKSLADTTIHFEIDDMQIAEDMQLITGHMLVQWLMTFRDEI
ncbi:MAG: SIS domain-containing protein [Methylocystis sp.]|jgi:D-sedoheptulose 7-phosphate isomerase